MERQAVGGETPQAWHGDDLEEMKMETSKFILIKTNSEPYSMFIEVDDGAKHATINRSVEKVVQTVSTFGEQQQ